MLKFLSWFTKRSSKEGLSKDELELIATLRVFPQEPLNGADLNIAKSLATRALLRPSGHRRFILTEKALVAYYAATRR